MAVPYDVLEPSDINRLFADLRARPGDIGVWDQHTFVVRVEEAIAVQLVLASKFGADIHTDEPVKTWSTSPSRVKVDTSRNSYEAGHLVIAAGGWTDDLLDGLLGMTSERQVMAWYMAQAGGGSYIPGRCPVFLLETRPPYEFLYGAPSVDGAGVRLSLHYGGLRGHPDTIDRRVSRDDLSAITDAMDGRLIGLRDRPTSSSVCFYPHTLDRVFCIGPHPLLPRIVIATGGSGHGYRFAQAVGELVADYIDGRQSLDLQQFYPSRFLSDRTL